MNDKRCELYIERLIFVETLIDETELDSLLDDVLTGRTGEKSFDAAIALLKNLSISDFPTRFVFHLSVTCLLVVVSWAVFFHKPYCGACRRIRPVFEALASNTNATEHLRFGTLDCVRCVVVVVCP